MMLDPLRKTTARNRNALRSQTPAPSGTLVHARDMNYLGGFRLPTGTFGGATFHFSYSLGTLGYCAQHDSLYMVGNEQADPLAEISIPALSLSTNVATWNTATVLQNMIQPTTLAPNNTLAGRHLDIGGIQVLPDNSIVLAVYDYYDGNADAVGSHLHLDSLTLATANVSGYYSIGAGNPGHVAGFMCAVPSAWQASFGYPYFTGSTGLAVVGRTSSGPAAFGWNPADLTPAALAGVGYAPTTKFLDYPLTNPLGPGEGPPVSPLYGTNTSIPGLFFVPNTNSVLYFGATAVNFVSYGKATFFGDTVNTGKGPHSLNGEYALQVWAYDANDLLAVGTGSKLSYEVTPYDAWNFPIPFVMPYPALQIGGAAYDVASGKLYVTFLYVDNLSDPLNARYPVICAYSVSPPATSAADPEIGAVSVTDTVYHQVNDVDEPFKLAPYVNPLIAGHLVTLTASNVYPITAGKSIVGVTFTVNGVAAGAAAQGGGNFANQWTLDYSTTGKTTGSYAVVATATDSGGRTGTNSGTLVIA